MKTAVKVFLFLSALLFSSCSTSPLIEISREDNGPIFIVLSYSKDDLCGAPQLSGILQAFGEGPHRSVEIRRFYLEAKKLDEALVNQRAMQVLDSFERERPRIVITVDDVAFLKVGLKLNRAKDCFVVFSGINGDINAYNMLSPFINGRKPISNITGVVEHLFLQEQVDFLRLMGKWPCTLALLYSTDFMGEKGRQQISSQLERIDPDTELRYFAVSDTEELAQMSRQIDEDKDICAYFPLVLSILDRRTNRRLTLESVVPDIVSRIRKLDIAVNKTFTRAGFFGGANVDMFHMGYQAGQMAGMLLDGVDIASLPVEDAARFQVIINSKRAKDLGIELDTQVLSMVDEII